MKTFAFVTLLVSIAQFSVAAPVSLTNAGFESPAIGDGASNTWPTAMPPGWLDNLASGATIINPTSGLQAFEGEQWLTFQIDNRFNTQYISQTTSEVLTAGTTYTASVWLGANGNGDSWGSIALYAGNSELEKATLVVPGRISTDITWTEWYLLSISYTASDSDLLLGQYISVRLFREQGMGSAGFDAVNLDATTVPLPATFILMLSGLLSLGLTRNNKSI